jgi:hypothetical protein
MKLLFVIGLMLISGCGPIQATVYKSAKAEKNTDFPFSQCLRDKFNVQKQNSFKSKDGLTYWEIQAVPISDDPARRVPQTFFFRTNGECKKIGDRTISRLKFMPRDAAIGLAILQHRDALVLCSAIRGRAYCIKELEKVYNAPDDMENQILIFPEDVEALKGLGIKAKVRLFK